jgi:hypothetical protein
MSGSEGGGEETTGRKAGTGASPPTLRGAGADRVPTDGSLSSAAGGSWSWEEATAPGGSGSDRVRGNDHGLAHRDL